MCRTKNRVKGFGDLKRFSRNALNRLLRLFWKFGLSFVFTLLLVPLLAALHTFRSIDQCHGKVLQNYLAVIDLDRLSWSLLELEALYGGTTRDAGEKLLSRLSTYEMLEMCTMKTLGAVGDVQQARCKDRKRGGTYKFNVNTAHRSCGGNTPNMSFVPERSPFFVSIECSVKVQGDW